MMRRANADAWALACRLFGHADVVLEAALSDPERAALAILTDLKVVKSARVDARYVLCPYCQMHRCMVVQAASGLVCNCRDCGQVAVDRMDTRAWTLDPDWMIRKLRGALDIPSQQAPVAIAGGIWRIGTHQRHTVIVGRNLEHVLLHPSLQVRAGARSANPSWLITPKPLRDIGHDLGSAVWMPLEERFSLYGGNVHFIEPGSTFVGTEDDGAAVNGPFSADFCTVHLDSWTQGPIKLSDAQAAVFKALWHFKGEAQSAERIMAKANLDSTKPIDVFKVKTKNKGDPRYEGPMHAYKQLVDAVQRAGTYALKREIASA